jgi:spore coat protein CotH
MYKDKNGKISMGPLWDFDWGFGYTGSGNNYFKSPTGRNNIHPFFQRLFTDPAFRTKYKERWNNKYNDIYSITEFIGNMADKLNKSQKTNYRVWQWQDGGVNYAQEISELKLWLQTRINYLNTEINKY